MARTATIILLASVGVVVAAFWPQYLARPFSAVDPYTHVHAAAGAVWLVLLIAQPAAIQARRYNLHRTFGRISYVVAPVFVLSAVMLSHHRLASMDDATFVSDGYGHFLPFYAATVFAIAYTYGVWYRHEPSVHSRFMLCTAVPLVDPVLGRVLFFYAPPLPAPWLYQVVTFTVATAVAGLLVFSYRGGLPARSARIGFFTALVTIEVAWFTIAPTALWAGLVGWFRSLPLT